MNKLLLGVSATGLIIAAGFVLGQTPQDRAAADTTITTTTTSSSDRGADVRVRLASYDTSHVAFRRLDRDGDGRISQAEAMAEPRVAAAFSSADQDNDGYLSEEEFKSLSSSSPQSDADASSPNGDHVSNPSGDQPATDPTDKSPVGTVPPRAHPRT